MLRYEAELQGFVEKSHPDLLDLIREKKALTDDVKEKLTAVLDEFKGIFA